jgi:hypothetical protein
VAPNGNRCTAMHVEADMVARPTFAAAASMAVIGLALATGPSACASTAQPGGSAPVTLSPLPPNPCPSGSAGAVTLTEKDSGHSVCMAINGRLEIYLHSTPDAKWAPIQSSSTLLHPVASGKRTLPLGVTAGFYVSDAQGSVRLTSSRPTCPPASASNPLCTPQRDFQVDVIVR